MAEARRPHLGETTGIVRAAGALLLGLVAAALILVVTAVTALEIAPFRHALLAYGLSEINQGETKIEIGDIGGRWPRSLILSKLSIGDAKGPWLSVEEAELDWRPSALLVGEVHIVRLSARGIDVARAPESTSPGEGGSLAFPALPVAIAAEDIAIDDLSLGRALVDPRATGLLARIDATGRLKLTARHAELALRARRTDATPGRLDAEIFVDQTGKQFDLSVSGEDGAPGKPGLVGTLGGLDGVDRVTIEGTGHNASDGLAAKLVVDGGRALSLSADANGRWTTDLDLATSLRIKGDLPARWLADLGRPREVFATANIHWGSDDRLVLRDLDVSGGTLALKGGATLARASSATPHEFVAQGTLDGLDRLLGKPGNEALAALGWRIAARLDMKANAAEIAEAVVTAKPGTLSYKGEAALDGSAAKGSLEADIADLVPVGQLLGQALKGSASAKLAPFALETDGDMAADFALAAHGLSLGDPTLEGLGGEVNADGSLILPKEGGFAVPAFTVTPATGAYRLKGSIASNRTDVLSGEAHFSAARIETVLPGADIAGTLSADAVLSGTLSAPAVALKTELSKGAIAGFDARVATLDVTARQGGEGPLAFALDGARGKMSLAATLGLPKEGGARLDAIKADIFGATLGGALAISDQGLASGMLSGERMRLGPLADLAGLPLDGTGDFSLTLDAAQGKQNASVSLDAPRITLGEGAATLERLKLDAIAKDVAGALDVDAKLTAVAGQAGITRLTSVSAGAKGPLSALALSADIAGTREGVKLEPVSFKAAALYTDRKKTLTLSAFRFGIADSAVTLAKPASIALAGGVSVRGLVLATSGSPGDGQTGVDLALAQRSARLRVTTEKLPLELATALLLSQPARGAASGTIDLDSGRGTGAIDLRFDKVALANPDERDQPLFGATVGGTWAKGRFDVAARAEGVSTRPFDLKASLPVIRDPKGAWPTLASRGALTASLDWQGPIASLVALADLSNQQLTGDATVALRASGDISSPKVSGRAALANGAYENFDSGTVLRNLTIAVEGQESENLHLTLDANDGGKGHVTAQGDIRLTQSAFPAVGIDISLANAKLVQTAEADAAIDGSLRLEGLAFPPTAAAPLTLKGSLTTTSAQIRIPDQLPGSVAQIDVVEINGGAAHTPLPQASAPLPLDLDIAFKIGAPMRISGRGLDSLWTGDLAVKGTADAPRIDGSLTSLRGNFDLAGKSFVLKKGEVRFLDRAPIDPDLDVSLVYTRSDLTATVAVTGRSSAPEIELTSAPDLPRDEILSRILFDKGAGELSAMEAVQLANTLAQLSGKGGVSGAGILDSVQQTLGLDVLQVGTAESGATTVAAGKYVRKGVYVGVEQGALASDSAVKVEIEITPQLSVDTKIGQNASGDVGVNWKWDY